ncbi:hypothetical protein B0H12DRAFT_1127748 [Mycena haematopus]|nr:hypothetical protein B0H12DRAFT_1127748 [Mycena haematopus]
MYDRTTDPIPATSVTPAASNSRALSWSFISPTPSRGYRIRSARGARGVSIGGATSRGYLARNGVGRFSIGMVSRF